MRHPSLNSLTVCVEKSVALAACGEWLVPVVLWLVVGAWGTRSDVLLLAGLSGVVRVSRCLEGDVLEVVLQFSLPGRVN